MGPPVQVADHGLEPDDLVEDRVPLLGPRHEVAPQQRLVAEQVPRGHGDELAGGHHAGRPVRDALDEDVRVAVPLGDEVADDVSLRSPAPSPNRRTHVREPHSHDRDEAVAGRQSPLARRTTEVGAGDVEGRLVEEADQPLSHLRDRGGGQADHISGDLDRVQQGELVQVERPVELFEQPVGARLHPRGVALHDRRREEPGDLAALLVVRGPVRDEDRVFREEALGYPFGGETCLDGLLAGTQHLTSGGEGSDTPHDPVALDARSRRLTLLGGSSPVVLVGHAGPFVRESWTR